MTKNLTAPEPSQSLVAAHTGLSSVKNNNINDINITGFNPIYNDRKSSIGLPADPLNYGANAMADKAMRMSQHDFVQRKCNLCEDEEKAQRKPLASFIQKKESSIGAVVNDNISNQIAYSRGTGGSMDANTKSFMELRFGTSFSGVKIHNDEQAIQMNRDLSAKAFTVGNDIYFNEGQYKPGSSEGKQLLAHELTHTIQQLGVSPTQASPRIQRQKDERLEAIKEKLRKGEKLSKEDMDYAEKFISKEILHQLLGGPGQIAINFDSSREPENINKRFQGKLELRMTSLPGAVAKSLEGVATADIDLVATLADEKAVITIGPPTESNRMAAMIRQQLFPNGSVRSFDFPFPKSYFKYANAVSLISGITVSITGKTTKHSNGMIKISHESVPEGIELIITLAPSLRTSSVADSKRELPGDHWALTPRPRIFGTAGYGRMDKKGSFTSTLGADLPFAYDTKNPLIYVGVGARVSLDTQGFARLGGTAFLGLNLDPLTLQIGLGTGAAFLREPIPTKDGPAQTVLYYELEGMAAYRILPNVELLMILSTGGGKDLPPFATVQGGVGYRF